MTIAVRFWKKRISLIQPVKLFEQYFWKRLSGQFLKCDFRIHCARMCITFLLLVSLEQPCFHLEEFVIALDCEAHSSTAIYSILRLTHVASGFLWCVGLLRYLFLKSPRVCSHRGACNICRDANPSISCAKLSNT